MISTYIFYLILSNFLCFGYQFSDIRLKKNNKFRLKKEKPIEDISVPIKVGI